MRAMTAVRVAIGAGLFAAGVLAGIILHSHHWPKGSGPPASGATTRVVLDNARVEATVVEIPAGGQRAPRTRPTDELVLFCEEAHYEAVDAQGRKEPRNRAFGTAVWHVKGEVSPTLVNSSARSVRYFSIGLK
jgi:hypothetical protein